MFNYYSASMTDFKTISIVSAAIRQILRLSINAPIYSSKSLYDCHFNAIRYK